MTIPFHEGELAIQQRLNVTDQALRLSSIYDTKIIPAALPFINQQPMLVIGSIDANGLVWASILVGNPGFVRALDQHTLHIDRSLPHSTLGDPLWLNLSHPQAGVAPKVGLIFIELSTRRRIRVNGHVKTISPEHLIINVDRAYPNCPKYIQRRDWNINNPNTKATTTMTNNLHLEGVELNHAQNTLIATADTFFVASAHPDHGVDTSHRGGSPGFVQIINNTQLRIPDFIGNNMFNTLGNFISYPYAGLIFIDFQRGRLLQLTGQAEVLWSIDDPQNESGGTQRFWQFEITNWFESSLPIELTWSYIDASPFNMIRES